MSFPAPKLHTARTVALCRWLLGLLSIATLAGFAGAWWWVFELFNPFRLQYCIAALLLVPAFWLLARPWAALVSAAVAAANLALILPLILPQQTAATASPGPPLRVMSANVFVLNSQHQRFIDYVRREQPDVLVVLEVTPAWGRALEQLAAQYPYRRIHAGDHRSGIAVLSRSQPVASRALELAGAPALLLTLEHAGRRIDLLGTHLYWPLGPRVYAARKLQLQMLAQIAAEHSRSPADPLVIVGDFNITPFSPFFGRLLRDGQLQNCARGLGLRPTWPARVVPLFIQIDHCVASAGVRIAAFAVGDYLGSDHYPIIVDID